VRSWSIVNVTTNLGVAGSGWACRPVKVNASMEVISPFFIYLFFDVKIRLLAERTSKQSAKGNTAKSNLCGIIAQSSIKSVKTIKLSTMYRLFCRFLTLFIIHGRQNRCNGWNTNSK